MAPSCFALQVSSNTSSRIDAAERRQARYHPAVLGGSAPLLLKVGELKPPPPQYLHPCLQTP